MGSPRPASRRGWPSRPARRPRSGRPTACSWWSTSSAATTASTRWSRITGADRSRYEALRLDLAHPVSTLLPVADGSYGLHRSLPNLAARYAEGKLALIQGVGTNGDLSHFVTQATMMAGTASSDRSHRLARALHRRPHRVGQRLPRGGHREHRPPPPRGVAGEGHRAAERRQPVGLRPGAGASSAPPTPRSPPSPPAPTGLGPMADKVGRRQQGGARPGGQLRPACTPTPSPGCRWRNDLTLAARVINADLGTRCVTVERQGFDTHASQAAGHADLLGRARRGRRPPSSPSLAPAFRSRVTVLVVSEFGRRAARNASLGTDHGAAGMAMVLGDNVKGGLYGAPRRSPPSTRRATSCRPSTCAPSTPRCWRPWLAGDASGTLGQDLRAAGPLPGRPREHPHA